MSQPYVGEIRMFGGNFAPVGWAFCDGQTLAISQNDTLFALIGTTYGGDGQQTFNLPNLQSRIPIHMGQGPGVSNNYQIGQQGGVEAVTVTVNQVPSHTHPIVASQNNGNQATPVGNIFAGSAVQVYLTPTVGLPVNAVMAGTLVGMTGGNQPHENVPPFLVINFIISLFGIFPSQN